VDVKMVVFTEGVSDCTMTTEIFLTTVYVLAFCRSFAFRTHCCTSSTWHARTACNDSMERVARWNRDSGMVQALTPWRASN